jgi:hypothetical protein
MNLQSNLRDLLKLGASLNEFFNMMPKERPGRMRLGNFLDSALHTMVTTKRIMHRGNKSSFITWNNPIRKDGRNIYVLRTPLW